MTGLFSKHSEALIANWAGLDFKRKVSLFAKLVQQVKREWQAEHIAMAMATRPLPGPAPKPDPTYDEAIAGKA